MIVDCFPFSNELGILEVRLATLWDVVDWFVIAESPIAFSGVPKPLVFKENESRFDKWRSKIRYVCVKDMPARDDLPDYCYREAHQKAAIARGLPDLKPDDVLIMGDCDEIPRPELVRCYRPENGIVGLELINFIFFLNLECSFRASNWTKLFPASVLQQRDLWWVRCVDCAFHKIIHNGAWHFTMTGGAQVVADKCQRAARAQSTIPDFWKHPENVQDALDNIENHQSTNMIRLFQKFTILGRDGDWPNYVRDNWDLLAQRGLIYVPKTERNETAKIHHESKPVLDPCG